MNNKHGVVLPIGRTHDYGKSTQDHIIGARSIIYNTLPSYVDNHLQNLDESQMEN